MAISLSKGGNLSLTKTDPSLNAMVAGLGWDARSTDGQQFDLDVSVFALDATGKVRGDGDFCFYNQLTIAGGAIVHQGDNRDGQGDGDDEQVKINLAKVPAEIARLAIVVTIDQAEARKQTFGMVSNAFIRLVNEDTGVEVTRFDLTEDMSTETAMIIAEIYRHDGQWKFKAVAQGFAGGLAPLARNFGVVLS